MLNVLTLFLKCHSVLKNLLVLTNQSVLKWYFLLKCWCAKVSTRAKKSYLAKVTLCFSDTYPQIAFFVCKDSPICRYKCFYFTGVWKYFVASFIYGCLLPFLDNSCLLNDKKCAQKVWSKTWCTKNLSVFESYTTCF